MDARLFAKTLLVTVALFATGCTQYRGGYLYSPMPEVTVIGAAGLARVETSVIGVYRGDHAEFLQARAYIENETGSDLIIEPAGARAYLEEGQHLDARQDPAIHVAPGSYAVVDLWFEVPHRSILLGPDHRILELTCPITVESQTALLNSVFERQALVHGNRWPDHLDSFYHRHDWERKTRVSFVEDPAYEDILWVPPDVSPDTFVATGLSTPEFSPLRPPQE